MRLPPWLTKEEKKERFATTVAVAATVLIFVAAFLANWRENLLFLGNHIMAALELLAGIVGLGFGFALIAVVLRTVILGVSDFLLWVGRKFRHEP